MAPSLEEEEEVVVVGGGHVAVLAFPFSTHAAPLLTLVRRLAAAAPTTVFSFLNTKQSNASILPTSNDNDSMPSNVKVYDVADGVPEGYVFAGKHQEDIELFMNAAPDNFKKSLEAAVAATGKEVSCLVGDAFFWFVKDMANDMGGGVPWVAFWTAGPASLSVHVHTDLIRDTTTSNQDETETIGVIPGMSKVRIHDLPEGIVFGNLESLFSRMLHQMGLMLPHATAVFINSFEELDTVVTNDLKSKFKGFHNVGPFNLLESSLSSPTSKASTRDGCLLWLDQQEVASVVYVSFGSVTRPSPDELMAIAEALEAGCAPFLWSLRNNLKTPKLEEFLSKAKLKNGKVVPWAPQPEVLSHVSVGAFVTHCGWNSVLESIAGGAPMICRPFFGDQKLNARMVEDVWKIGLKVEGGRFTKDGMLQSMEIVLKQERGSRMREKISTLKQLAHKAVGPKGSSTLNFKALVNVISKN